MCNCLLRLQLYESKPNKVYSKQRLNGMDYFLKILRSVVCVLLYVKKEYKNMKYKKKEKKTIIVLIEQILLYR